LNYDPVSKELSILILGNTKDGHSRVAVVPAGHWQAARPVAVSQADAPQLIGNSLAGCTVGPGFEFADFRFVSEEDDYNKHFETVLKDYRNLL